MSDAESSAASRYDVATGLIFMLLGFALVFRSWPGLIATALAAGALVGRIFDEEKMLRQEFGQEWDSYCQHTWRFIPRVW